MRASLPSRRTRTRDMHAKRQPPWSHRSSGAGHVEAAATASSSPLRLGMEVVHTGRPQAAGALLACPLGGCCCVWHGVGAWCLSCVVLCCVAHCVSAMEVPSGSDGTPCVHFGVPLRSTGTASIRDAKRSSTATWHAASLVRGPHWRGRGGSRGGAKAKSENAPAVAHVQPTPVQPYPLALCLFIYHPPARPRRPHPARSLPPLHRAHCHGLGRAPCH